MILHLNSFFPILLLFYALIFTNFMHCDGAKKHHKRAIISTTPTMTTEAVNGSNGTSAEPEAEEEEEAEEPVEPDLTVFNDKYLERINDFLENGPLHKHEIRSMLSKLGKIALFLRLYRSSITSPTTGHRGFDQYFPQPSIRFHPEVYDNCTNKDDADWIDFKYCVDTIFESVQQRAKFIFPVKGQPTQDEILLEEVDFARRVSNSKFSFDMSASYLLCFLTKRNLTALRRLPFCSYGTEPHQSNKWPAGPFRQYCDTPEIWPINPDQPEGSKHDDADRCTEPRDPIDTFDDQVDFECADVSFCPDPCCGRKSKRFFRGEAPKATGETSPFGFCNFSSCSMYNIKHLNDVVVSRHFKSKLEVDRIREKFREEDGEEETTTESTTTTTTESTTMTETAMGSATTTLTTSDKNGKEEDDYEYENEKEGGSGEGSGEDEGEYYDDDEEEHQGGSMVNTHYCYLDKPFNDDFLAIMENRWNLSCACAFGNGSIDRSKIYRFDVLKCVDVDECMYRECPEGQECMNLEDGSRCVCPMGSYRFPTDSDECKPLPPLSSKLQFLLVH